VDGGRAPGRVGDHPAPDGDDDVGSRETPRREPAAQVFDGLETLGLLALAHDERALLDAGVDVDIDALLGDDGRPPGPHGKHLEQPVPGAAAHQHVVRAVAERDGDGDQAPTSTRMRSATWSAERSSTTTTRSASSS